jgi:hypothetical protein
MLLRSKAAEKITKGAEIAADEFDKLMEKVRKILEDTAVLEDYNK